MKEFDSCGHKRPCPVFGLLILAIGLAAGCDGGYAGGAVPVTGVVRFNGEPLTQGTICFHDATGLTLAIGMVDRGSYEMSRSQSHKGVLPGNYKVSVLSWTEFPGMTQPNGSVSKGVSRIPLKYTNVESSGLSAEVDSDGATLDFAVEGQAEAIGSAGSRRAGR